MKTLIRLFLVFLVVVAVAGAGLAYYLVQNINSLIAEYKPDLERMASEAVGSTVTFGDLSAKIFPQTAMMVDEVKVVHESRPDETLTLSNVALQLQLLPLLSKDLVIETLALRDPKITLILDHDGIFIAGLPRGDEAEKPAAQPTVEGDDALAEAKEEVARRAKEAMPIQVQLHQLAIENASIVLKDTIEDKEYTIEGMNLATAIQMNERAARMTNLDVVGTALGGIDFAFEGASVLYNLAGGAIEIKEMNGTFLGNSMGVQGALDPNDSSKIMEFREGETTLASLGPVYDAFAPGLHDLNLGGTVAATVRLWLESKSSFNADAVIDLHNVRATVGEFQLEELTGPVTVGIRPDNQLAKTDKLTGRIEQLPLDMSFSFDATPEQARMKPFHLNLFSGSADMNTTFALDGTKNFVLDAKAQKMRIEEMIAALAPDLDLQLTGNIESVTGDITGRVDDAMTQSLKGDIELLFNDGVLEEVNVMKEALGKITELPFINDTLLTYVPERYQAALVSDKTHLDEVRGTFDLAGGVMTTDDLYVQSTYFTMESTGTIGLDAAVDLNSIIYFSKEFSDALAVSVKELKYAYDDQGRFTFPLTIKGVAPDFAVRPDVSGLMKGAVKNVIVGEGLKRLLGEDEAAETTTDTTTETSETPQTTEEPEDLETTGKKLLRGLLD